MSKIIHLDLNRCIYCHACEVACEREHRGISNIFITLLDERQAIPLACRHCEKNPCLVVCPTNAIERKESGAVIIHSLRCIGCKLCALVCPFGVIQLDEMDKVVRKCDLCVHRLEDGKDPACVKTCSARAMKFGEFDKIMADVREKKSMSIISGVTDNEGFVVTLPERS